MGSHANISEIIYEIFNLIKSNNLHSKPELIKLAINKDSKNLDTLIDLGVACAQNQKLDDALFILIA